MAKKKAGPVETRPGYVFITWENCNPNLIKLFRLIGDVDDEAWIFLPGSNEITIEIIANMHVVFKHANIIKHQIILLRLWMHKKINDIFAILKTIHPECIFYCVSCMIFT